MKVQKQRVVYPMLEPVEKKTQGKIACLSLQVHGNVLAPQRAIAYCGLVLGRQD